MCSALHTQTRTRSSQGSCLSSLCLLIRPLLCTVKTPEVVPGSHRPRSAGQTGFPQCFCCIRAGQAGGHPCLHRRCQDAGWVHQACPLSCAYLPYFPLGHQWWWGGGGGIRLDAHFQTPAVFFLALTPGEADHPGALHPRWPRRKEASWLQPQASWGLRAEPDFLVLSQSCCVAGYLCPCGLLVTVSRPVGRTPNSLVTFQGFRL